MHLNQQKLSVCNLQTLLVGSNTECHKGTSTAITNTYCYKLIDSSAINLNRINLKLNKVTGTNCFGRWKTYLA